MHARAIPELFSLQRCKQKVIYTSPKPVHCTHLVHAVSLALVRSALRNSSSEVLESSDGGLPVDASIGDGHALLQAAGALRWDLLVALVDVGLDHDTDDAGLAVSDLVGHILCDLGLVAVVLVGVAWCC